MNFLVRFKGTYSSADTPLLHETLGVGFFLVYTTRAVDWKLGMGLKYSDTLLSHLLFLAERPQKGVVDQPLTFKAKVRSSGYTETPRLACIKKNQPTLIVKATN